MASAVNNGQQLQDNHKEEEVGLMAVDWRAATASPIVQVEYCLNCELHGVKHSSIEYLRAFEKVQRFFHKRGYQVRRRDTPKHLFRQSPYWPTNLYLNMLNGQSEYYPQQGAFEIYIGNMKLYSRLVTQRWPYTKELFAIIDSIKHPKHSPAQQQCFSREKSSCSKQRYLQWLKKAKQPTIQHSFDEQAFYRPNSKKVYRIPSRSRTLAQTRQINSQQQNRNPTKSIQHSVQASFQGYPSRNTYFKRNTLQIEGNSRMKKEKPKLKRQDDIKNHLTQRFIERIYLEDMGPLKKIWRFDLQHRRQNLRQKCEQMSDRSKMPLSVQSSKYQ